MIVNFVKRLFGKSQQVSSKQEVTLINDNQENDGKIDLDEMILKTFVYLESLYRNQEIAIRRSTEDNRITLGEVLRSLFENVSTPIISLAVTHRIAMSNEEVEENVLTDVEQIDRFDLFSCILKHKTDEGYYTQGMLREVTLIASSESKSYILSLMSLGGNDAYKYMRVSLMSPDSSLEDDCKMLKTHNAPQVISFVLSNCEDSNDASMAIFDSIEASYRQKNQNGVELNDIELEYVHGMFEFQGYHYIGYGNWLLSQNRYCDAYSKLERAFNYILPNLDEVSNDVRKVFLDICNKLGTCASKLGRETEASYFFKLGASDIDLTKANQLALSHARMGNPIATIEMQDWLQKVAMEYGEHENWTEEVKQFSVDIAIALCDYKESFDKKIKNAPRYNPGISLEYILSLFFNLSRKNLAPCIFVYDNRTHTFLKRIENVDDIDGFIMNSGGAKDKTFVMSCTHAYYLVDKDGEDKSILAHNAILVVSTHTIKNSDGDECLRVDAFRSNFATDDDNKQMDKYNIPIHYTLVLPTSIDIETFSVEDEDLTKPLQKAISLADKGFFVDSHKLSLWTYEIASDKLKGKIGINDDSKDEELWSVFYESAYRVGFCLMEMNKMREASYYLEIASHSNQSLHAQEYINCLTNTQSPIALEVVDDILARSPKPEDDEGMEAWNFHISFLNRRKAYILIDKKRYNEAKQILQEMLNNPLSKEFAQSELQYIESLMSK